MTATPWFKMSTSILTDAAIVGLDDAAAWLYVRGLAYCAANLTDGHIDADGVRFLAGRRRRIVDELVDAGLWAPTDGDDPRRGVTIRNYLDHQRSRAQVDADRAAARRRQRRRRPPTLFDDTGTVTELRRDAR